MYNNIKTNYVKLMHTNFSDRNEFHFYFSFCLYLVLKRIEPMANGSSIDSDHVLLNMIIIAEQIRGSHN